MELFASLQLFAKGDPLFSRRRSGSRPASPWKPCKPRPHDWWREGDRLHVRFRDATPEVTPLVVYLVHREATAPAARPRAAHPGGFHKVTGEAVVAAHKGWTRPTLTGAAKEIRPQAAAELPGAPAAGAPARLRIHRGGICRRGQAPDAAGPPARHLGHPRGGARKLAGAQHEVRPRCARASIDRTRFSLRRVPEARVTGGEVRETRSHVEGDRRIYEIEFQSDVSARWSSPSNSSSRTTAALPSPRRSFPTPERTAGFMVIENGSEGEMSVRPNGLDPATAADLPWAPASPAGAEFSACRPALEGSHGRAAGKSRGPARLLRLGGAHHRAAPRRHGVASRGVAPAKSRAAISPRAPARRRGAGERARGRPERARGCRHGGRRARRPHPADQDEAPASFRTTWKPSTASLHPPLSGSATHDLHDPTLLGITVERTFWHLWLPKGYLPAKLDGNMEQVLGGMATADKLDEALKELHDLSSVASAAENGYATRSSAVSNFGRLKDDIAKQNGTQADIDSRQPGNNELAFNKGKDGRQRAYVLTKPAEVQKALESEIERLSKNAVELDTQKPSETTKTFAAAAAKKVWADAPAQLSAGGTATFSGATTVNGEISISTTTWC